MKKLNVLVVEDEALTGKLAVHFLEQYGSVRVTGNAREAGANYMVQKPDIVFLDIHYSHYELNGLDVLQNFLSLDKNAFIVMFSADQDKATIAKAMELGARGFINKPFKASDFRNYINMLTGE